MGSSKRPVILFVIVLGGLGVLAMTMIMARMRTIAQQRAQQPATTPPTMAAEDRAQTNQRLFLEEHRRDDGAREFIFRDALRKGGQRCDSIASVLMSRPGVWTVRCPPGHVFVFKFDKNGDLQSATKVQ